jgi:hypothetical protein
MFFFHSNSWRASLIFSFSMGEAVQTIPILPVFAVPSCKIVPTLPDQTFVPTLPDQTVVPTIPDQLIVFTVPCPYYSIVSNWYMARKEMKTKTFKDIAKASNKTVDIGTQGFTNIVNDLWKKNSTKRIVNPVAVKAGARWMEILEIKDLKNEEPILEDLGSRQFHTDEEIRSRPRPRPRPIMRNT